MGSRHCSEDWNGFPESTEWWHPEKNIPHPGPQWAGCGLPWPWGGGPSSQAEDESWARVQQPRCGPGHGAQHWQGLAVRHGKLRPAGLSTPACAAAVLTAWVWTAQNWNCPKNVIKSHCQNHTTALHFPIHLCCFFFCATRGVFEQEWNKYLLPYWSQDPRKKTEEGWELPDTPIFWNREMIAVRGAAL